MMLNDKVAIGVSDFSQFRQRWCA